MYTTRAGKDVLEAQGVHKCCPWFISFLLILLFTSRAVYDLVAVNVEDAKKFGFGWTFATDMVSGLICSVTCDEGNCYNNVIERVFVKEEGRQMILKWSRKV